MKKRFAVILTLLFVLSLAGCTTIPPKNQDVSTSSVTESISDYLIEENGKQYLILPISKNKVTIWDEQTQYLDNIDLDLLKAAEEKISEEISKYADTEGYFYLEDREGYLCLCAEVIVDITPPSGTNGGGCGVDHEHKFFNERFSK